jgi:2-polyprenyl-3-methyl-5-hydroxy-6-metoxy-1,4-benzoquinol methylase
MELKNNTRQAQSLFVWFDVTTLEGRPLTPYPYYKPIELRLEGEASVEHQAHILVPYSAPTSEYLLRLVVGPTPATSWEEENLKISVALQRALERNRCNLCGQEVTEESILQEVPPIRLAKCGSCGLVFDFDMEDAHSLLYEFGQVCEQGLAFERNIPTIVEAYDRKNELVLGAEVDRIRQETADPNGKRLLDFGCGTGGLLNEARRAGFQACGIETNEAAAEFVSQRRDLPVFASIEALREEGGDAAFDVVVARHTLEHVANPMRTLKDLRDLLRPGGLLVIIVPHFNFFARRILPNSMPRFSYGLVHKGHQYYFTKETLARYLRETGFPAIEFPYSILGGFLSRWIPGVESSRRTGKEKMISGSSAALSRFLHVTRISPVLTAYAR